MAEPQCNTIAVTATMQQNKNVSIIQWGTMMVARAIGQAQ